MQFTKEYNHPLAETVQNKTLHENVIAAARETELQERPIVKCPI
jgi:hypothetical protein